MLENAHTVHFVLNLSLRINGVQTTLFLYCDGSLMQNILPVIVQITVLCECLNRDPCVWFVVSAVEILV